VAAPRLHGQDLSSREAISIQVRQGILDSASAQRLENLLDEPVLRPSQIPDDLLERIPGMDPDCAVRVRSLAGNASSDRLDGNCRELLAPYLRTSRPRGSLAISSSSRLEDSPGWNRNLRAAQALGPASAAFSFSPDRPSPWTVRRASLDVSGWSLAVGDLAGWSQAPSLWNRPIKAAASRSFLDGAGTSMNGIEAGVGDSLLSLRLAAHRRGRTSAAIAGIGGLGQFLSIVGGSDSGRAWCGIALESRADFDGIQTRFQPSFSRRDTAWNSRARLEMSLASGALGWSSWALWDRRGFPQPLAASPSATGPLKPLPTGDWRSGGIAVDHATPSRHLRVSLTSSVRGDGAACLLPVLSASQAFDSLSLSAEIKPWRLFPADAAPRTGISSTQSAEHPFGAWSPRLRLEESLDTSLTTVALAPSLGWVPLPTWEARAQFRQFLSDLSRRELSLSTTLHPARTAFVTTELVHREGTTASGTGHWYFRLEASSRW